MEQILGENSYQEQYTDNTGKEPDPATHLTATEPPPGTLQTSTKKPDSTSKNK